MKKIAFLLIVLLSIQTILVAETKVLFSPDGGIQSGLVQLISQSKNTIDIMIYSFTSREIASSLVYAHDRGVKIRVIADKLQTRGKSSLIGYLSSKGIKVKVITGIGRGIMHNKVGIFDGTELVTGSYNWTNNAEYYSYENAIFTDEKDIIGKYVKEFEKMWKEH